MGNPVIAVDQETFANLYASYSADRISEGAAVRKPTEFQGKLYLATGSNMGKIDAYVLVSRDEYTGDVRTYRVPAGRECEEYYKLLRNDPHGFYHGMLVKRGKGECVLVGPEVTFVNKSDQAQETGLIAVGAFELALAEAKTIPDIKSLVDRADLFRQWLKKQKAGLEAQNAGAEMHLRATRKLGEMLVNRDTDLHPVSRERELPPEISYIQSHRWQKIAEIPEDILQQYFVETRSHSEEITAAGLLRYYVTKVVIPNARRNRPLLPPGVYNVIYADPPWQYENTGVNGAAEKHYHTLAPLAIAYYEDQLGTKIQDKILDNAVLFLWTTNPFLEDAFDVLENWGFEYKTNIVWVKTNLKKPGAGFYIRGRHELLLICTRGSFVPDMTNKEPIGSVIEAPVQEHSKKPAEFYELIEKLYPPGDSIRHLELFARNGRRGWTSWGDELQISSEIPGGERGLQ